MRVTDRVTDKGKVNLVDSGKLQCGQLTGRSYRWLLVSKCCTFTTSRHSCVLDEAKFIVKGCVSKQINEIFM